MESNASPSKLKRISNLFVDTAGSPGAGSPKTLSKPNFDKSSIQSPNVSTSLNPLKKDSNKNMSGLRNSVIAQGEQLQVNTPISSAQFSADHQLPPSILEADDYPSVNQSVEITEVLCGLFLGSEKDSHIEVLQEKKITHVLCVAKELRNSSKVNEDKGIQYHYCDIRDTSDEEILPFLDDAIAFIDNCLAENSRILVHCSYGISRSPSFVIAYLMKKFGWSVRLAYDLVRMGRKIISPNVGFMMQLQEFEKKCSPTGGTSESEPYDSMMSYYTRQISVLLAFHDSDAINFTRTGISSLKDQNIVVASTVSSLFSEGTKNESEFDMILIDNDLLDRSALESSEWKQITQKYSDMKDLRLQYNNPGGKVMSMIALFGSKSPESVISKRLTMEAILYEISHYSRE